MTDSRQEFHARTVAEALAKASESLSVPEGQVSYEVLDSGSEGFLGIGARDARILVAAPAARTPEDSSSEYLDSDLSDELVTEPEDEATQAPEPEPERNEAVSAEVIKDVDSLVNSIITAMGLSARVDVYDAGDCVAVDVVADHTALFIGQKGETIDAVQHLVNASVYNDRPFEKRIILDSEGYRQRRVEAIQGMAHRIARKAVREGRPILLPPMNSSERRVVHVFLKDNPDVTTASEGSDDGRRVVVSPE